jgi:polyisoprenoid-binding protein YceI
VNLDVTHFKCIVHPVNKRQICGADGTAQIKRSDFGLTGLSNSIGEDIRVTFGIEAIKE